MAAKICGFTVLLLKIYISLEILKIFTELLTLVDWGEKIIARLPIFFSLILGLTPELSYLLSACHCEVRFKVPVSQIDPKGNWTNFYKFFHRLSRMNTVWGWSYTHNDQLFKVASTPPGVHPPLSPDPGSASGLTSCASCALSWSTRTFLLRFSLSDLADASSSSRLLILPMYSSLEDVLM
jgi:hypothetical protein